ncbi:indole-3-glycerol phosphate synthase TrpC [Lentilactobacillus sp. SPB1-3]|uniref:Indole-3-glycerol phosphate synthase TrpC n=1 Tax=Lentilactobacillus terminaliae TaxID=3003483 RepID=A0ACD5DEQ5_9LACO|nr:indole-3-glycerol phosphate synthase TrpC [Lentilactobacillus sp. SPB1-3]MCZ0976258.1 indole-3-glycerol phosphate synthase TrpC [Lentilactobacillus sp. SPB1-3]
MILDDLVSATRQRITDQQNKVSLAELKNSVRNNHETSTFYSTLSKNGIHIIAEVKQASPSKGIIATDFPYIQIAQNYQSANVDAISVLTEPKYFHGQLTYLNEIAHEVTAPILRKDFVINEYMIYEAKASGASIILLITAILTNKQLKMYRQLAESLGMDAIVEVHSATEIKRAVNSGAKIIGINNRNLKDFTVDLNNSLSLKELVPNNILTISESGIKTKDDVHKLKHAGFNGILIGETLMRASNKRELIKDFKKV